MRLFYDKELRYFEEEVLQKIINELSAWNVKEEPIERLIKRVINMYYNLTIPVIEGTATSELILSDVDGQEYTENVNAQCPDNTVCATGIYSLKYRGSDLCFRIKPTIHTEVGIPISVQNGVLQFRIRTNYVRLDLTEEWKRFLRDAAIKVKENIELNLNQLRTDFDHSKQRVDLRIKSYINNRIEEINNTEKRNNEINPFK